MTSNEERIMTDPTFYPLVDPMPGRSIAIRGRKATRGDRPISIRLVTGENQSALGNTALKTEIRDNIVTFTHGKEENEFHWKGEWGDDFELKFYFMDKDVLQVCVNNDKLTDIQLLDFELGDLHGLYIDGKLELYSADTEM